MGVLEQRIGSTFLLVVFCLGIYFCAIGDSFVRASSPQTSLAPSLVVEGFDLSGNQTKKDVSGNTTSTVPQYVTTYVYQGKSTPQKEQTSTSASSGDGHNSYKGNEPVEWNSGSYAAPPFPPPPPPPQSGQLPPPPPPQTTDPNCPDMLVRRGNVMMLYHSTNPNIPPKSFHSVQEYVSYLESMKDKKCPVLFLQEEIDAQGQQVFRVRPTLDGTLNGLPQSTTLVPGSVVNMIYPPPTPSSVINSNRFIVPTAQDDGVHGSTYQEYDPHGQHVGQFTKLDAMHVAEEQQYVSANPMDPNWGGIAYTSSRVDSGAYADRYVYKPNAALMGVSEK